MEHVTKVILLSLVLVGADSFSQESSQGYPDYYGAEYQAIVTASKQEKGLLIYGNIAEYNWRPVIEAFQQKYPWIDNVETLDLGPTTGFERYYAEISIGKHSADLFAVASPGGFQRLIERGELLDYESPETGYLPEWSFEGNGLYTISADPMVIVYNKLTMPEEDFPHSLADLRALATTKTDLYRDKITTYDATKHSFAYDIHWSVQKHLRDDQWALFDDLGSVSRPESGASPMVEKITSGEYSAGFFVSGIAVFPRMEQAGRSKIIGWSLIEDGTPIFLRGVGLTKQAQSPNSAKLLLDFVLSHDGQVAVAKGGLTPYRSDLQPSEVPYVSYSQILEKLGEENVVLVKFDEESVPAQKSFVERWKQSYRKDN